MKAKIKVKNDKSSRRKPRTFEESEATEHGKHQNGTNEDPCGISSVNTWIVEGITGHVRHGGQDCALRTEGRTRACTSDTAPIPPQKILTFLPFIFDFMPRRY